MSRESKCAWTVCTYPLSCFSLGAFAGPPGKRDYLENFHPGSQHHITGIPANQLMIIKPNEVLIAVVVVVAY